MRRLAAMLTGVTVLSGLLGSVALAGTPSGNAEGGSAVPAPAAGQARHPDSLPRAPKGGCQRTPEPQRTEKSVPYPQRMFGTDRIWPLSTGAGVTIAVLDSGVDTSHPHLSGKNIRGGADFYRGNGSGSATDCDGHGTAVASLIAGRKVADVGFQGLAYGATILPVVVADEFDEKEDATRVTSPAKLARAIDWAVDHGADVIHVSPTLTKDDSAVKNAITRAIDNDVVVVAAVGNRAFAGTLKKGGPEVQDPGPDTYPASYEGVIGVGAVGPAKDGHYPVLKNSQWGGYVDIAAPGGEVLAANRGGGHAQFSGTGIAAAFVSAAAALVRSKWPELTVPELTRRLSATASPAAGDRFNVGSGLVDPYRALTEGLSDESPVALPGVTPPSLGPKAAARAEEEAFHGGFALAAAGVGVLLAGGMLATLTLLPKGIRRRWRPGRTKPFPEPKKDDDDMPPAPVKLFEDLETT
ncbi:MAG: S8 family serine peptidase [Micromonosporaceae bacterium]